MVGLGRGTGRLTRLGRTLRRHWLFAVLLAMATVLRAAVYVAYHPALIFPDSVRYLQYAHSFANGHWSVDELRQSGYSVLIIPVVLVHDLWIIPLVQHLVGLATAVLVYAVLVHFGIRAWIAALATIPVLFDPLQLILEQYVLTDVWTVFLIVAALVILVWNMPNQRGEGGRTGGGLTWRRGSLARLVAGAGRDVPVRRAHHDHPGRRLRCRRRASGKAARPAHGRAHRLLPDPGCRLSRLV